VAPGDAEGVEFPLSSLAREVSGISIGSEADPARIPSAVTPGDGPGPSQGLEWLTQRQRLAFFDVAYDEAVKLGHVGLTLSLWHERALICMLVIVSHYLNDGFWGPQTAHLGGDAARHRVAPPKTYERMFNKSQSDYAARPSPTAMYVAFSLVGF
jgi:hypothetical protein